MADELAFYKFQSVYHRAWISAGNKPPTDVQIDRAGKQIEQLRVDENRDRYAHAEAPREIGS